MTIDEMLDVIENGLKRGVNLTRDPTTGQVVIHTGLKVVDGELVPLDVPDF